MQKFVIFLHFIRRVDHESSDDIAAVIPKAHTKTHHNSTKVQNIVITEKVKKKEIYVLSEPGNQTFFFVGKSTYLEF